MNVKKMSIKLEIYLDYYIFPVVIKHNITFIGIIFHPIVTASKPGFTNLNTELKSNRNS